MSDDQEFAPEECKGLRRLLREYEAQRDRDAQERARRLTKEVRGRYGPFPRE